MREIEELENTISKLKKYKNELYCSISDKTSDDRLDIEKKLYKLTEKIFKLEEKLILLNGPEYTNGVVDVYLNKYDSNANENNYYLTLHNSFKIIGHVRLTFNNMKSFLGNIGYSLDREYRGNGYMIHALKLLKNPLIERNINKPILTVYSDNIPSIKTIEKLGGRLIEPANDKHDYDIYEVDLTNSDNSLKR